MNTRTNPIRIAAAVAVAAVSASALTSVYEARAGGTPVTRLAAIR